MTAIPDPTNAEIVNHLERVVSHRKVTGKYGDTTTILEHTIQRLKEPIKLDGATIEEWHSRAMLSSEVLRVARDLGMIKEHQVDTLMALAAARLEFAHEQKRRTESGTI